MREMIVFLVFTALWVEGQGMHLGANSIGHLLENAQGTDAQTLTHFYDEVLGHYLWHIGLAGLTLLLIWRQMRNPLADALQTLRGEAVAALIYGIVYAIIVIEAGTVPLGLPIAVIVTAAWTAASAGTAPPARDRLLLHGARAGAGAAGDLVCALGRLPAVQRTGVDLEGRGAPRPYECR